VLSTLQGGGEKAEAFFMGAVAQGLVDAGREVVLCGGNEGQGQEKVDSLGDEMIKDREGEGERESWRRLFN
jgi:hypothetical protein